METSGRTARLSGSTGPADPVGFGVLVGRGVLAAGVLATEVEVPAANVDVFVCVAVEAPVCVAEALAVAVGLPGTA